MNELKKIIITFPNILEDDVPIGDKEKNIVLEVINKYIPQNNFISHMDICIKKKLVDYDLGRNLSGSKAHVYTGDGAELEWALIQYMMDIHKNNKYKMILVPHILDISCGYGSGQFPKFIDDVYWIKDKNKFLIPTAETALINIYANKIINEKDLPICLYSYSPCYRKEAGGYHSTEKGMIRTHQFNKVEMVCYVLPGKEREMQDKMVEIVKNIIMNLNLHARISLLASKDVSFSMSRTIDVEVYIPSINIYKEVSSISNASNYQSKRNNTRVRLKDGTLVYPSILNGSGVATSRLYVAILEQCQDKNGNIIIPNIIRKYINKEYI